MLVLHTNSHNSLTAVGVSNESHKEIRTTFMAFVKAAERASSVGFHLCSDSVILRFLVSALTDLKNSVNLRSFETASGNDFSVG